MKIKRLFIVGVMVVGAFGLMPAPAQADCLDDEVPGTVGDKYLGGTCSGCGWIMINGKMYDLFRCD